MCRKCAAITTKSFVVVWGVVQYGKCPIELLCKNCAYNLVREGHLGEGYLLVRASIDLGAEAVGATNDEDEAFYTAIHTFLEPVGILDRAELRALFIEQNNAVGLVEQAEDSLALGGFLLRLGEVFGVTNVGYVCDIEAVIEVYALGIHIYKRGDLF